MGDHRASIKIEASFHGVKDSADMWINWVEHDEVPSPVREFFEELYRKGYAKYEESMEKYREEQKKKEERRELERLKKKYEVKS